MYCTRRLRAAKERGGEGEVGEGGLRRCMPRIDNSAVLKKNEVLCCSALYCASRLCAVGEKDGGGRETRVTAHWSV